MPSGTSAYNPAMGTEPQEPFVERWTAVGPYSLYARVSSNEPADPAPPIVLIHGFAVSGRPYVPTLAALGTTHRVYVPDPPGYGKSSRPDRALSIAELADALVAWLDAEGLDMPVLAGHSLGGQVVAEVAQRHPGRIHLAVLIAPTGDPRARFVGIQLTRLARDAIREPLPLILLVTRDYLRFGLRNGLAMLRWMSEHPMPDRLAALTMPALLVAGERDPLVPARWRAEIMARLPDGSMALVPGAGHGLQFTAGDQLADTIRSFIEAKTTVDGDRAFRSASGRAAAGP